MTAAMKIILLLGSVLFFSQTSSFAMEDAGVFIISSTPVQPPTLSSDQKKFLDRFKELSLNSILDLGPGEQACKDLGQEAFDFFKNQNEGDSIQAFSDLQAVVDSITFSGGGWSS